MPGVLLVGDVYVKGYFRNDCNLCPAAHASLGPDGGLAGFDEQHPRVLGGLPAATDVE
jgi:hypothetical protein